LSQICRFAHLPKQGRESPVALRLQGLGHGRHFPSFWACFSFINKIKFCGNLERLVRNAGFSDPDLLNNEGRRMSAKTAIPNVPRANWVVIAQGVVLKEGFNER
jgi:hypothetical protein